MGGYPWQRRVPFCPLSVKVEPQKGQGVLLVSLIQQERHELQRESLSCCAAAPFHTSMIHLVAHGHPVPCVFRLLVGSNLAVVSMFSPPKVKAIRKGSEDSPVQCRSYPANYANSTHAEKDASFCFPLPFHFLPYYLCEDWSGLGNTQMG